MQVKIYVFRWIGEPWNSISGADPLLLDFKDVAAIERYIENTIQAHDIAEINVFNADMTKLILNAVKGRPQPAAVSAKKQQNGNN